MATDVFDLNDADFPEDEADWQYQRKAFFIGLFILFILLVMGLGVVGAITLSGGEGCGENCVLATGISSTNNAIIAQQISSETAISIQSTQTSMAPSFAQGTAQPPPAQTEKRVILRNAHVEMEVANAQETADEILRLTDELGGWLVSSDIQAQQDWAGRTVQAGSVSVRVPAARLDEALAQIRGFALNVKSATVTGTDVTDDYVDSQSRIRNLQAAEAQLQTILEDAQKTEDVLTVFNRLTEIRSQIEELTGRIQYYEGAAAFSSIQILLAEPALPYPTPLPTATPTPLPSWNPSQTAKNASGALMEGVQISIDGLIWFVIFILPFILVIGGMWWIAYRLAQRW